MTKTKVVASLNTFATVRFTGSRLFTSEDIPVPTRNVRAAITAALRKVTPLAKLRGEKVGVLSIAFFDEVRAEAHYRHKGTGVVLKGATRKRESRMTFYIGPEVRPLTRREVAKSVPSLAKRMRELGYPYAIRVGWSNYVCCKDYRLYKGYIGLIDAARIDYPPYSIWSVL